MKKKQTTKKKVSKMDKPFYENLKLVLDELDSRTPKTNKDGFLPHSKVLEAIEYFKPMVEHLKGTEISDTDNIGGVGV